MHIELKFECAITYFHVHARAQTSLNTTNSLWENPFLVDLVLTALLASPRFVNHPTTTTQKILGCRNSYLHTLKLARTTSQATRTSWRRSKKWRKNPSSRTELVATSYSRSILLVYTNGRAKAVVLLDPLISGYDPMTPFQHRCRKPSQTTDILNCQKNFQNILPSYFNSN